MEASAMRFNRREFCRGMLAGLSGSSVALGSAMGVGAADTARESKPGPLGIARLRLRTHRLAELRAFYHEKLQFPTREAGEPRFGRGADSERGGGRPSSRAPGRDSITFQAGTTALTFVQTEEKESQPFYHFAFNIPENKLPLAKEWLARRTPLALRDGEAVFHFPNWNAHSIYFWDPAGNLGELIARHNLPNARSGAFTPEEILYASEIGLVVEDVPAAVRELKSRLGLQTYRQGSNVFEPVGDEHRLLIVAQKGRPWMHRASEIFPTVATLYGAEAGKCDLAGYPYAVEIQSTKRP
jgi:catechol-2,3-dioxygenase